MQVALPLNDLIHITFNIKITIKIKTFTASVLHFVSVTATRLAYILYILHRLNLSNLTQYYVLFCFHFHYYSTFT